MKTSGVTKYFLVEDVLQRYQWKQGNRKRTTYYTMITLFNQTRKYYNQNNKILCLASHMALQAAPLISTTIVSTNGKFLSISCDYGTPDPLNSILGYSDRHAQLLTAGNFQII